MTDPRSIEAIGLKKFLDSTAWKHFDNDYDDLVVMIDRDLGPGNIGKMFGVDWRTADKWVKIYKKELEKK